MERIIILIALAITLAMLAIIWIEHAPPAKPAPIPAQPLRYERTNVQFPGAGIPMPAKYLEV